jgi:hypothetical protein
MIYGTVHSTKRLLERDSGRTDPWRILYYIHKFRRRDLTYQSDSVNTLSGVFRASERRAKPIYQIVGIPILFLVSLSHLDDRPSSENATQGFALGLTWLNNSPAHKNPERVSMFPSWSWAGWTGSVKQSVSLIRQHQANSNDSRIWFETSQRTLRTFPPDGSLLGDFVSQVPRDLNFILIEAGTFTCFLSRRSQHHQHFSDPEFRFSEISAFTLINRRLHRKWL